MRNRLQKNYKKEIIFTATVWVRWTKKDWTKTIALENIIYQWEKKVDDHLWIIGECNIPKWTKVCCVGDVYCYDDMSDYGVTPKLLVKVPESF